VFEARGKKIGGEKNICGWVGLGWVGFGEEGDG